MESIRSFLGMGSSSSSSRGGEERNNRRTPKNVRAHEKPDAAKLQRSMKMQLDSKRDELEEVQENKAKAVRARNKAQINSLILKERALKREINVLTGKLSNQNMTQSVLTSAQSNYEQGILTREAADEISALNQQTEDLDLEEAVDDLKDGALETLKYSDMLAEPIFGEADLIGSMGMGDEMVDDEMERLIQEQEELEATEATVGLPSVPNNNNNIRGSKSPQFKQTPEEQQNKNVYKNNRN